LNGCFDIQRALSGYQARLEGVVNLQPENLPEIVTKQAIEKHKFTADLPGASMGKETCGGPPSQGGATRAVVIEAFAINTFTRDRILHPIRTLSPEKKVPAG
jgi:hypothetical protein